MAARQCHAGRLEAGILAYFLFNLVRQSLILSGHQSANTSGAGLYFLCSANIVTLVTENQKTALSTPSDPTLVTSSSHYPLELLVLSTSSGKIAMMILQPEPQHSRH